MKFSKTSRIGRSPTKIRNGKLPLVAINQCNKEKLIRTRPTLQWRTRIWGRWAPPNWGRLAGCRQDNTPGQTVGKILSLEHCNAGGKNGFGIIKGYTQSSILNILDVQLQLFSLFSWISLQEQHKGNTVSLYQVFKTKFSKELRWSHENY